MKKEISDSNPLSCHNVDLDEHDLSILIESLQTLLHHRVSTCDSRDTPTMFQLLLLFKTLSKTEHQPF